MGRRWFPSTKTTVTLIGLFLRYIGCVDPSPTGPRIRRPDGPRLRSWHADNPAVRRIRRLGDGSVPAAGHSRSDAAGAEVADRHPDGTFRPCHPHTRGQFTKMSVSGLGVDTVTPVVSTFGEPGTSPVSKSSCAVPSRELRATTPHSRPGIGLKGPDISPLSTFSTHQSALRVSTNAAAALSTSVADSRAASRRPAVC